MGGHGAPDGCRVREAARAGKAANSRLRQQLRRSSGDRLFGPRYGLLPSISTSETYWLWGPRKYAGSTVIVLGSDGKGDREFFQSVEPAARVDDSYAQSEERFSILLCRGMKQGDLRALWPKMRKW